MDWLRGILQQRRWFLGLLGFALLLFLNQVVDIILSAAAPSPARHRDVVNHWTDVFNVLDLIAGPRFLLLFALYCGVVTLLIILVRNMLHGLVEPGATFVSHDRLPLHLKPTFLEVAYLRGREPAMLEAALCNLYRLGVLSAYLSQRSAAIVTGGKSSFTRKPPTTLTSLEMAICNSLNVGIMPYNLATDSLVQYHLSQAAAGAKAKLRMLGLLPTSGTWFIVGLSVLLALLLVDGVAGVRLIRSSLRGYHNVLFLQLLTMAATLCVPIPLVRVRQSQAGKQFLRRMRADAKTIIRKAQTMTQVSHGPEVLYAIAAVGAGTLGGTAYETIHSQLIPPRAQSSGWGDSSSCSSCGGGSCGGGGCGGGGCGGG